MGKIVLRVDSHINQAVDIARVPRHIGKDGGVVVPSGVHRKQAEEAGTTIMDSNDQERERGITILAKNLAVMRNGVKINIVRKFLLRTASFQ